MTTEVSITLKSSEEKNTALIEKLICEQLKSKKISLSGHTFKNVNLKRSIDARHGQLKIHLRYKVYIDEEPPVAGTELPIYQKTSGNKSVIIVGSGPAGLFAALRLLEDGIKPVILERGEETSDRRKTIALISTRGEVNANSNFCFGEGGAGTFSDGKLYTRSNKRGNISKHLQIFHHFGADQKILTDAHPHIGTEKLPGVINNMKDFIREMGGELHFNTKVEDFIIEDGRITGVKATNLHTEEVSSFHGNAVILATGHSATDIYELLASKAPSSLEAKTFAMGVRVEHPRALIDAIQYHGEGQGMGAAEYRLVTQVEGRGVYSFCMCPGGFVVPSSTTEDTILVNGMSASGRNSQWSNAAIVVETRDEDIPETFKKMAESKGCPALAGLYYRTHIEKETKRYGNGQKAPSQVMTDFLAHRASQSLPDTSYTPGLVASRLDLWLPEHISGRLGEAFHEFGKNMKGFVCKDALMIATETRTSTPVRILRDKESLESVAIKGLYPAGEGAGYAGGIISSSMDGEKVASAIANLLKAQ